MFNETFKPALLIDGLGPMTGGMNNDLSPLILPKDTLSFSVNITNRGSYVKPRPPFQIHKLDASAKTLLADAFRSGSFQDGAFYNPDVGDEYLVASIAGRLFKFDVLNDPVTVEEITIPGNPNPASQDQAWMWQSEKWLIVNDGISTSIFWDGTTAFRSSYSTTSSFSTFTTASFVVPNVGALISGVTVNDSSNIAVSDILTFKDYGTFLVQASPGGGVVDLVNLTAQSGQTVPSATGLTWAHTGAGVGNGLPPGRMGAYGMGRNWICLIDGKQFVASDIVGGSSGTAAENYRNSVLHITENNYLAGGGFFTVPGSIGEIRAMIFSATLDASLGQGPLQVFTHSNVFSCNAPVDRLTWQDVTNPILTQSLIGNGALAQNSTVLANSDILFRSVDGIRSQILGRRDFNTWGNVPQSAEVNNVLQLDSPDLLRFSTAIIWDNRLLMSARPAIADQGIYHRALVALNFDPISSLKGKLPSCYDGIWTGLNILKMVTGEFRGVPRAFAFTLNVIKGELEIYEFLMSDIPAKDNQTTDIVMEIQSAAIFNYEEQDPRSFMLKRLHNGVIYVDQIPAGTTANFQVYYKPDQWPCWVPWHQWSECAGAGSSEQKPQFRPSMGLGEPSPIPCDATNNRPLREGYTFQIKIIFSNCRFLGAKFWAITVPQSYWPAMICDPLCPPQPI